MSHFTNINQNRVSVKTDSMVDMIKQLSKLGVFKNKKKTKKTANTGMEGIKQDNLMVGYAKSLTSPQLRNIIPIQQIEAGMSQQQIEDIQRTNAARFAALQGEVEQHRSETQQTIGGLVGAASQRFAQIGSALSSIVDPQKERFRGSTFPAQEQGAEPVDPFSYARGGRVPRQFWLPETSDVPMDQTLNEGGPGTQAQFATSLYPEEGEEESGIQSGGGSATAATAGSGEESPMSPRGPITRITRKQFLENNGLPNLPANTKNTTIQTMRDYYTDFCQVFGVDVKQNYVNNKDKMYREMVQIIEDEINLTV